MIKAVIFDCFGVVVSDGFANLVSELNMSQDQIKKVGGLIDQASKGAVRPGDYEPAAANILRITPEEYRKIMNNNIKNKALLEYVLVLKQTYKVGMLSNVSSRASLESRFDGGELNKYFDAVVASADIGYAKPEAQAYETIAAKLNVRLDECVMIDDRAVYCEGANSVGMKSVIYTDFESMKQELQNLLTPA